MDTSWVCGYGVTTWEERAPHLFILFFLILLLALSTVISFGLDYENVTEETVEITSQSFYQFTYFVPTDSVAFRNVKGEKGGAQCELIYTQLDSEGSYYYALVWARDAGQDVVEVYDPDTNIVYNRLFFNISQNGDSIEACMGKRISYSFRDSFNWYNDGRSYSIEGNTDGLIITPRGANKNEDWFGDGYSIYDNSTYDNYLYLEPNIPGEYTVSFKVGEMVVCVLNVNVIEDHKGEWIVAKEPTCKDEGIQERICSICGQSETEIVPATGHQWNEEYTVDKEATCAEEGSESIHCSVCDEIKEGSERTIAKLDHKYGDWVVTKDATCTEDGSREKVCADCGDKVIETIPATGHQWNVEYTTDKVATCTEEGSESIHCSVCDEIKEGSERAIAKLDHNYGEWEITKGATCTEDGTRVKRCKDCGDEVTETILATGHAWNEDYTVDKEPTCTEEGSKSIHCAICDESKDVEAIPANGHSFGEWETVTASTCEDSGLQHRICEVCGVTETTDIDPNGHVWGEDYTVDKAATCTEDGSESIHCKNCDAVKDSRTIPANGHSYGEWVVKKEPTCTEDGLKEQTCQICGDIVSQVIPATGHSWESTTTIDKAATCTKEGSQSIHCANCDETKDVEVIPATGHEWGEPTYVWSDDNSSVTATRVCKHDSTHVEKEVVKTTSNVSKAATYTAAGETTYTAVFTNETFTTQTKTTANIAKLAKKTNTLTVKGKTATVKLSKLKKKNQTITAKKAFTVSRAQGKVTYKKASGNKKITVSSIGKVTVKKGLKKGTYKVKVKVTAAGTTEYKPVTKTVTIKVKVK